jgi:hypothetical protein
VNIANQEPYVGRTVLPCPEVGLGDRLRGPVNSDDLPARPHQIGGSKGHVAHTRPKVENTHASPHTGGLEDRSRRGRQYPTLAVQALKL